MDVRKPFRFLPPIALMFANFGCGGSSNQAPPPSAPITVSVTPATATVQTGSTAQLAATVTNDSSQSGVGWAVSCAASQCGTIIPSTTPSGAYATYTAPASISAGINVTVTATSVADSSKSSSATLIPVGYVAGYGVGVDYDGYGTDPLQSTVFIPIYNQPQVRQIVQAQLQGMADLGATFVTTNIWLENLGQSQTGDIENFPLTDRQAANLHTYAQDVAAVQGANGNRLRLNLTLSWLAASDFTIGSPSTGLGSSNLPAAQFTADVQTTIGQVLGAISNMTRPDGVLVVDTVFLVGEILLPSAGQNGALEENSGWFMTTNYPYFVSAASQAGVRPSVYFGGGCEEDVVFDDSYADPDYPILNAHRSIDGVYTGVKFMVDNGLPLPTGHIDFDSYMDPPGAPYEQILQRVLDDADAVLPSLGAPQSYFMPETYYLADPALRLQYGQAFASQAAQSSRLQQVSFWAYRTGMSNEQVDNAFPFAIEDFLARRLPDQCGLIAAGRRA